MSSIYYNIFKGICGRAGKGVVGQPSGWPAGLVSFYNPNAASATRAFVGPQPVYAAASQQPDANGNLVTWPNYVPGRGVEVHPAYTKLGNNSVFAGAVAGSPGTTPTGWTYTVVDSPTIAVTDVNGENKLTFSGTASRGYLSLSQSVAALAVYTFDVMVTADGVLRYTDLEYCSLTGGTIVVMKDGVVIADETAVPAAGTFKLSVKVTAGAVGDTAIFRFGLGASAVATGTVSVWQPQLVLGAYSLPYVRSTTGSVSVASTAATSAGNGLAIPLDARMTAALSAGGRFTAAALCWMGVGSGELPTSTDHGCLSVRNINNDIIYFNDSAGNKRIVRSFDGTTNAASVQTWGRGEIHLKVVQTNAAGTQFRVGNRRYTSAMVPIDALTWGAWANYDGSMNPLTHLRFGYNSTVPIGFLQTQVWNKSCTDAEILNLLRYAS